jgi:hypothetical protein
LQLDVEGPITLDEASLARIAATNGTGIGYFMEADIRDDIVAGRLVRILEDWTPPLVPLCLYYSNRRNSSAAFQAFIALARLRGGKARTILSLRISGRAGSENVDEAVFHRHLDTDPGMRLQAHNRRQHRPRDIRGRVQPQLPEGWLLAACAVSTAASFSAIAEESLAKRRASFGQCDAAGGPDVAAGAITEPAADPRDVQHRAFGGELRGGGTHSDREAKAALDALAG